MCANAGLGGAKLMFTGFSALHPNYPGQKTFLSDLRRMVAAFRVKPQFSMFGPWGEWVGLVISWEHERVPIIGTTLHGEVFVLY